MGSVLVGVLHYASDFENGGAAISATTMRAPSLILSGRARVLYFLVGALCCTRKRPQYDLVT